MGGEELRAVGGVEAFGQQDQLSAGGGGFKDFFAREGEVLGLVGAWGSCQSVMVDVRLARRSSPVASWMAATLRGFLRRLYMLRSIVQRLLGMGFSLIGWGDGLWSAGGRNVVSIDHGRGYHQRSAIIIFVSLLSTSSEHFIVILSTRPVLRGSSPSNLPTCTGV